MTAANTSKEKGLQFSNAEMELVIQVLKRNKSPEETARIDQMLQMIKMLKK